MKRFYQKTSLLNGKNRFSAGMTLVETVIAVAMTVIIFLAIVPIFYAVRKGWDLKEADAEVLQSGRVLIDHISRTLSQAAEITEVGAPCTNQGHIVFIANDGNSMEYTTGASYVTYGPAGQTQYLAGPVTQIHFACYDGNDFSKHVDANNADAVKTIRMIQVLATVTHPTKTGHEKDFATTVYLRTKYSDVLRGVGVYDKTNTRLTFDDEIYEPVLAQIDTTHYLCAYRGGGSDGFAGVLTVNTTDWSVTKTDPCEFDPANGFEPALAKIDPNHYLCAYRGTSNRGYAVVLDVNSTTWKVKRAGTGYGLAPTMYTTDGSGKDRYGYEPALVKIDGTHYLCAYRGDAGDGYAIILTVNTTTWAITKGTYYEYETSDGKAPALAQVDATHYLCAYGGPGDDGFAVILIPDTGAGTITKGTAFEYDTSNGLKPALIQINSTKYLCAYEGNSNDGYAVVLSVNTGTWAITKAAAVLNYEIEYDTDSGWTPTFSKLNSTQYFCVWESYQDDGAAGIFVVDANTWTLSLWEDATHFTDTCAKPELATQIDPNHFLCVYQGSGTYAYADIFERYRGGATGGTPEP
jgi:type II secretory pathway pseudopilin PulG